jgi:hypothetical protein
MIGILISGRVFRILEARAAAARAKANSTPVAEAAEAPEEPAPSDEPSGEVAAAIAMALHLHRGAGRMTGMAAATAAVSSWTMSGRGRIMDERSLMFNRGYRRGQ